MWRSARGGTSRPTLFARALGHRVDASSEDEATAPSRVQDFPQAFLPLLRKAIETVAMTPPTAAAYAGLTIPDVVQMLGRPAGDTHDVAPSLQAEFDEFEANGAVKPEALLLANRTRIRRARGIFARETQNSRK